VDRRRRGDPAGLFAVYLASKIFRAVSREM